MARRVAGTVIDIEFELADSHLVAIFEPAVRLEAVTLHAKLCALSVKLINPEAVFLLRTFERDAFFLRQLPGHTAVIEMPVGDEHLFERHARLVESALQHV